MCIRDRPVCFFLGNLTRAEGLAHMIGNHIICTTHSSGSGNVLPLCQKKLCIDVYKRQILRLWVIIMMVCSSFFDVSLSNAMTSLLFCESKFPVGSSARIREGRVILSLIHISTAGFRIITKGCTSKSASPEFARAIPLRKPATPIPSLSLIHISPRNGSFSEHFVYGLAGAKSICTGFLL